MDVVGIKNDFIVFKRHYRRLFVVYRRVFVVVKYRRVCVVENPWVGVGRLLRSLIQGVRSSRRVNNEAVSFSVVHEIASLVGVDRVENGMVDDVDGKISR